MPTWWSAVPKGSPHPQQCDCRLQGRRWWDLASESKTIQGQDRRKRIAFGGLWKGRLKSISSRFRETPPAGRPTNCEPSAAGRSWKGGARERADDVFFAAGIKRRRSKADFAPTWRRRRDSNPRTAFDRYAISSRAPSTKLGDSSIYIFFCANPERSNPKPESVNAN